jgi:hypothetical protein
MCSSTSRPQRAQLQGLEQDVHALERSDVAPGAEAQRPTSLRGPRRERRQPRVREHAQPIAERGLEPAQEAAVALARRDRQTGGRDLARHLARIELDAARDLGVLLEAPARHARHARRGPHLLVAQPLLLPHAEHARAGHVEVVQRQHHRRAEPRRRAREGGGEPHPVMHVHDVGSDLAQQVLVDLLHVRLVGLVPGIEVEIVAVDAGDKHALLLDRVDGERLGPLDRARDHAHGVACGAQLARDQLDVALGAAGDLRGIAMHDLQDLHDGSLARGAWLSSSR